ncbi:MAG: TolC family protein [Bacteroidales bacterium]
MKHILYILIMIIPGSALSVAQSLEDYFAVAAENNPGLQAKYLEYEAALQNIPRVTGLPDPSFSFGYFISPVETRVGPQRARFSLTQMFPWFGTLKAEGNVAALQAESLFQSFIDEKNRLYYRVAGAWYSLFELYRWMDIEQENIEILESYKRQVTSKYRNGKGGMVDVLRVDNMINESLTSLEILEEKEKSLLTAFNSLLNRDAGEPVNVEGELSVDLSDPGYSVADITAGNPALRSLELKIEAGKAGEEVARKRGLPGIGVGVDYVVTGERTGVTMDENGKDILMPMVSVTIPLWRKKYNAAIRSAQLLTESNALKKEEYTNFLETEYETLISSITREEHLVRLYGEQIENTEISVKLLLEAYSGSGKEFEEVLRMQQQLLQYRKMRYSALARYHTLLNKMNYITAKEY